MIQKFDNKIKFFKLLEEVTSILARRYETFYGPLYCERPESRDKDHQFIRVAYHGFGKYAVKLTFFYSSISGYHGYMLFGSMTDKIDTTFDVIVNYGNCSTMRVGGANIDLVSIFEAIHDIDNMDPLMFKLAHSIDLPVINDEHYRIVEGIKYWIEYDPSILNQ